MKINWPIGFIYKRKPYSNDKYEFKDGKFYHIIWNKKPGKFSWYILSEKGFINMYDVISANNDRPEAIRVLSNLAKFKSMLKKTKELTFVYECIGKYAKLRK